MIIYRTAEEAITASVESNTITRVQPSQENLDALQFGCDDSAEGDEFEFCGTDEHTGAAWRVHAART